MHIDCPKCTDWRGNPNKMYLVSEIALPSNLERPLSSLGEITAYKCRMCGTHKEIVTGCAAAAKTRYDHQKGICVVDKAREYEVLFEAHQEDIRRLKAEGKGFRTIIKELILPCSYQVLHRHWPKISVNFKAKPRRKGIHAHAKMLANFDEIHAMRVEHIAATSIISLLNLDCSSITFCKYYKEIAEEKGVYQVVAKSKFHKIGEKRRFVKTTTKYPSRYAKEAFI